MGGFRIQLEEDLQQGRDRLLEYNSCRPKVATRICSAMHDLDKNPVLSLFFERFLDNLNIDYSISSDGTWVIEPINGSEVNEEYITGLPFGEAGISLTFHRQHALNREELAYMTHEHPLMQAIYEMICATHFGSTAAATLTTAAMPQGLVLLECYFKIESVAPKALNLNAFLPNTHLRLLFTETGEDLSHVAPSEKLTPLLLRLEPQKARQIIKLREQVIKTTYQNAQASAYQQLQQIAKGAQNAFGAYFDKEIKRLTQLQRINPNVKDSEIAALVSQKQQGLQALEKLSLIPDSIRLLVTIHPSTD